MPELSIARRIGLLTLWVTCRSIVIVILKLVQVAAGH